MFMFTTVKPELFPGQNIVNKIIVVLAVICIPWMLLSRPVILYMQHKKRRNQVRIARLRSHACRSASCCAHSCPAPLTWRTESGGH